MNNLTHCPHCGKSLYEPKKPDLSTWSLEAQIMAGVPNIYIPRSDKIKNALREHFKITPFWSSKFERQWMEWAVSVDMTEKQILYASWTFQADDRYNWQAANLKSICDHWLDLSSLVAICWAELQNEFECNGKTNTLDKEVFYKAFQNAKAAAL